MQRSTNFWGGANTQSAYARSRAETWDLILEIIRLEKLAKARKMGGQSVTHLPPLTNLLSSRLQGLLRTNPLNGKITLDEAKLFRDFMRGVGPPNTPALSNLLRQPDGTAKPRK